MDSEFLSSNSNALSSSGPSVWGAGSRLSGGCGFWLSRRILGVAVLLAAAAMADAGVVINEIHYAPDVKTERVEFIELYNSGTGRVDLTSWRVGGGIDFVFTNAASIAPDSYIVVAQDPAALALKFGVTNAVGPWTGRLSNESDKVVLHNDRGELVDEVSYQLGFPWPTVGAVPGHSIELVNPNLDNNLGGSWRSASVGGEALQGQTLLSAGSSWKYFKGTMAPSSPATAWRQPSFDDSLWASGTMPVGFGDNAVATVLDDMQSKYTSVFFRKEFVVDDPNVSDLVMDLLIDDGLKLWLNGTNIISFNLGDGEVPYTATATSSVDFGGYMVVPFADLSRLLRPGTNLVAAQVHNASLANSDFAFDLAFRTQPGINPRGATPGARNSVYAENVPPQVRQVNHVPEQPISGQPVRVTAKITDADGVAAVELQYQVNRPGAYIELGEPGYEENWASLPMNDTGTGPDLYPGDAIYSAEIPGAIQAHRHLVRYRILVTDQGGRSLQVPYADDPQPNFAYFVYDGVPAWSGAIQPKSTNSVRNAPITFGTNIMRKLPVYHLISKKASVEQATWPKADEQYWGDQYLWKGTLIYDGKVYDHIGYRARGGSWRYSMGKNMWKFAFNRGHDFEPRDNYGRKYDVPWRRLNLGACIQQADYLHRGEQGMFESVGFRLFNLAGVEAPETHFVQLRIVDDAEESNVTNQYTGDFWGLYLAVEQEDGHFLDEHGLPDGNLYKMEGGTGELSNQGYQSPTDKSDLETFMANYRSSKTPEEWWLDNFDLDRYYSYQAVVQGIHHYDICAGKNYFYFADPHTHLWSVHPWDIDLTWANNMYNAGCGGTDEFRTRVMAKPAFKLEYQNRVREIRDLLFNTNQAWRLIDEFAAMIDDPGGGPAMVDADRAMWDYNPIMADNHIVNPSKAGQGRFYQVVPTKDFPGMVKEMKDYVVTRATFLDNSAADSIIPETPSVTSSRSVTIPANRLLFQCSSYSGANPFAAMKWRVGEVTPADRPPFDPAQPATYEIQAVWETPELTAFTPSVTVPVFAVKVGHTYRVRARMEDNTGRWSHWSAPVEFTVTAADATPSIQDALRITEIMYQPTGGGDFEFLELHNSSLTSPLDLAGARFTQGIDYTFPSATVIAPGGYLLVVRAAAANNFAVFRAHYGIGPEVPIAGPFSGALNNDGELITLKNAVGTELASFTYGNGRGWPLEATGAGHSLVLAESALNSPTAPNLSYPGSWRGSSHWGGSPGTNDAPPVPGVVLNEIAAHTDYLSELDSNDWIELYNLSNSAVDLGTGWFLSDDPANLKKWRLPAGTGVQPHASIVFDEVTDFHTQADAGFGLNKDGEQVLLSYLPGSRADRVVDSVRFKAQENDWSIGRYPDGSGPWIGLSPRTRGASNSPPPQGVVIHEVMFHPQSTVSNADDNSVDEYIELYNPTAAPVDLYNAIGAWRLDGGIQFLFPPKTTLGSRTTLLLVNFDPTNANALEEFKNTYGLTQAANILGPYTGKLNNSTDRIALEKPQFPDLTNAPPAWVIVDEVIYSDRSPWPEAADGAGLALQRISLSACGNDPANWRAAIPSPGTLSAGQPIDTDKDGMPDDWERAHSLDPNSAGDAVLDRDGDGLTNLQEYLAGTDPAEAESVLRVTVVRSGATAARLRFTATAQNSYRVWYCDSLEHGLWQVLMAVPADNVSRAVEIEEPMTSGARYYRLELTSTR